MNETTRTHVPSAEFRAMLEAEVVRAFQREAQFATGRRWLNPRHARGFMILLVGLVMGFTTQFASGQVQDAQERDRLLQASAETRQLAGLRLGLAEQALTEAQIRYNAGLVTREGLLAAEAEVKELRMRVARIDSEIAEIRVTAAPPRDDLWAPRVGDRDFVSDRLRIEAATFQDRLSAAERLYQEIERSQRVGTATATAVADAEMEVADARRRFELAAMKLQIRRQFLEENLSSDEVMRRWQRFELMSELQHGEAMLRRAMQRVQRAREHAAVGVASELEAKRAEVELLELQLRLKSVQQQLRQLEAIRKEP